MRHKTILFSLLLVCWTQCAWASDTVAIQTIILESQGESMAGQVAVGEVIRNRAKRGDLSVDSVCLAYRQFSCWNDGKQAKKALSKASGETWQRASKAWAESEESNLTNGATHYHARKVHPYWVGRHKGIRIGNHVFYRGIK